jgi:hypothetical protein
VTSNKNPFRMTTPWGKRRGWEIQRLLIRRRVFYRMTWRNGCLPANYAEVALWRATKMPFGTGALLRDGNKR